MVNFVIGRCGTGKSTVICNEIVKEIREGERQVVLIVPEQQTVSWETKMARLLPPSANFRLEITNFTRLANSVFREYGGLADVVVDEGTRSLLIWRAMLSVWDQLQVYNHCTSGREDRNIPHLMSAVDELKNSGITPEMAENALEKLIEDRQNDEKSGENDEEKSAVNKATGDLISRLSDAVLVYSAYNALLHEEYIDRGDLLDNLANTLMRNPYFEGKVVFIDSFFSLTKAEERILARMMQQADDVTLTFACPPTENQQKESHEEEFGHGQQPSMTEASEEIQFREIRRYLRTATSLAYRAGQEINRIELRENLRHRDVPELALIERYLFDYLANIPTDIKKEENESENGNLEKKQANKVQIIQCADIYDEAEACAAIVDKLLREGYMYSDIAIVARNMKSREGIVDSVLRRHGVRYFLSETSDVANLPAVRFVLSALAIAANGWQRRDIIRHLKTGLTLVGKEINAGEMEISGNEMSAGRDKEITVNGKEECNELVKTTTSGIDIGLEGDIFEIYTETWNVRGRKQYTGEPWSMNPAGYKTERTETAEEMLRLANSAKEKLIVPLERLLSVFDKGVARVREIAERIVYYAEDCRLNESLEEVAEAYRKLGLEADAEKTLAGWDKVCEILDQMVQTLGDSQLDAGRFAGLFARVAASMDVGTIPTGVDEVVMGSASGVRFDEVKCVIMLGAVEGEFPGTTADSGNFFGEKDKEELEIVGLELGSPDLEEQTAREFFMFYRTAASAKERLYILTQSAEKEKLSEGAIRVQDILGKNGIECTKKLAKMPIEDIIFTKETAQYLLYRRTSKEELAIVEDLMKAEDKSEAAMSLSNADAKVKTAQIKLIENIENDEIEGGDLQNRTAKIGRIALSQSKIESFVQCPFKYWCQYQLKLQPIPKAEIRATDIGTFMHTILERFFGELPKEKLENLPLSRKETEEIADKIISDYVDSLAANGLGVKEISGNILLDGRLQYLFLRLKRHVLVFLEALMREFAQSEFRPVAYEMPIGIDGKNGVKPLVIKNEAGLEITLQGIADRIDIYEDEKGVKYVRIVDYKTGSKVFSLDDVKRGLNVQLLIYLFSVWKYGLPKMNKNTEKSEIIYPAGAIYFQAKPTSISSETMPEADAAVDMAVTKIERTGALLSDETVLRAMDNELAGEFIRTKLDSFGELKAMRKSTSLLTLEEFAQLEKDLESVIGKIGERMVNGEAEADPMKIDGRFPCEWCDNRIVCRNVQY